jgi:2-methylcitrate dehydratase PrpD
MTDCLDHPSRALADFAAGLRFDAIPAEVVARAVNLYVDWLGSALAGRVDEPKGDPGSTLSREEIEAKVRRLAAFSGAASEREVTVLVARAWTVAAQASMAGVFEETPA